MFGWGGTFGFARARGVKVGLWTCRTGVVTTITSGFGISRQVGCIEAGFGVNRTGFGAAFGARTFGGVGTTGAFMTRELSFFFAIFSYIAR